jgi:Zn-dependent M28 family amino/carboxypeptidase
VRVLIGSHYDTRLWADHDPDPRLRNEPIQGANDGGSGVAVMLELARVIAARPPAHGVDLVVFDGEDYGPEGSPDYFLGSRHLAAEWERDPAIVQPRVAIVRPRVAIVRPRVAIVRPRVAIVLDMVGDADLRFAREATAQHQVPWLNDQIWATGRRLGLGAHLSDDLRAVVDDHTALLQAGVPATLLIDFEYPHWHAAGDTLDKCSAESLGVTGRLVVAAVLGERLPGAR